MSRGGASGGELILGHHLGYASGVSRLNPRRAGELALLAAPDEVALQQLQPQPAD